MDQKHNNCTCVFSSEPAHCGPELEVRKVVDCQCNINKLIQLEKYENTNTNSSTSDIPLQEKEYDIEEPSTSEKSVFSTRDLCSSGEKNKVSSEVDELTLFESSPLGNIQSRDCQLKNSKKILSKGKFILNLLASSVEKKSSSSKPEKNSLKNMSKEEFRVHISETHKYRTPQIKRNHEYAAIKALSQALKKLRIENSECQDDLLQNEKALLVSTEKVKLYTKNINSSKDAAKAFFLNDINISISKILIGLKSENEENYKNAYFICLVCTDDDIFPTKLAQLISKTGNKFVEFDDNLDLQRLAKDFTISLKVYSYHIKHPKIERTGLLKLLPKKTLAYPIQICRCQHLETKTMEEEVFLLPMFKQCAEFTISKGNFRESNVLNSFSSSIFHEYASIKKSSNF